MSEFKCFQCDLCQVDLEKASGCSCGWDKKRRIETGTYQSDIHFCRKCVIKVSTAIKLLEECRVIDPIEGGPK